MYDALEEKKDAQTALQKAIVETQRVSSAEQEEAQVKSESDDPASGDDQGLNIEEQLKLTIKEKHVLRSSHLFSVHIYSSNEQDVQRSELVTSLKKSTLISFTTLQTNVIGTIQGE